jgi:hypothetical protein
VGVRGALAAAAALVLAAGCAAAPDPHVPGGAASPAAGRSPGTAAQPGEPAPSGAPATAGGPTGRPLSTGWTVTVYYTAVEALHSGAATRVTGCPRLDCRRGDADLGSYPAGFVDAVRREGTGRTAGGSYLNWSHDTGFWLDTAPRDAAGRALRPWQSAAADPGVLPAGTAFTVADCGTDGDGGPIDPAVCDRIRRARWSVTDEFTPGLGGERHVDVYLGEETGPDFVRSPWYTTLEGATLRIG